MPPARRIVAALALGFVSYGLSVVLAVRALRILGAARQAALFATAPFVGAVAAVPLLDERFGLRECAVGALMALGVTLLLGERHGTHTPTSAWSTITCTFTTSITGTSTTTACLANSLTRIPTSTRR